MFRRKTNACFGKVCLAAMLAVAACFGAAAVKANAEPQAAEYQVSFGGGTKPRVSGDRIIWNRGNDVYLYDIPTKSVQQITAGGKSFDPAIDGNRIVWTDSRDTYTDIYMYDTGTGQETQITNTSGKSELNPVIYGNIVVYKLGSSLYMHEVGQGTPTKINNGDDTAYADFVPAIYGDYIVWHETVDYFKTTVNVYRISTGLKTELRPETSKNPVIYGSNILWEDKENNPQSHTDIYLYNLDSQQGGFIATGTNNQYEPAIGSKYAVWRETVSGISQIVAYDLTGGTTTQITDSGENKYTPSSDGDRIVWQQGVNTFANSDIGPTIIELVNGAASAEAMEKVMQYQELGLTLGGFKNMQTNDKAAIAAAVLAARPASGYADKAAVQTAFDTAMTDRKPMSDVNLSRSVKTMKSNLENPALGLDLTAYNALSAADQYAVAHTVIAKHPENKGYPTLADLQTALNESIQRWTSASWRYLGAQTFYGWFADMALYQGTPYVVYEDYEESEKATVKKYDGTSWVTVGNPGMSDNKVSSPSSLAFDSSGRPWLAYYDQTLNKLSVKKFDGTTWQLVGNAGFSDNYPSAVSLVLDHNDVPYVAYRVPGKAIVNKFDGTNWVTVGTNSASEGDVSDTRLVISSDNNALYLAYTDQEYDSKATVLKLVNDEWTPVGSKGFSDKEAATPDLALDSNNVPYVAFWSNDQAITVMKFDGTNWVPVGSSPGKTGGKNAVSLAFGGDTLYLAYINQDEDLKATVKKFDGTNWLAAGNVDVTDGWTEYLALAVDGNDIYLGLLDRTRYMNNVLVLKHSLLPAFTYTIEEIADQTAGAITAGYASGQQETKTVTIKRTGTGDLTQLTTALSGAGAGSFEVSQPAVTTLNDATSTTTFTLKAKDGLAAGTYTATVTVTADLMTAVTFTITQVVKPFVLKGDVNLDGQVTPADALYITRYLAGSLVLTAEQIEILDMDNNSILDTEDVKMIIAIYMGGQPA